MIHPTQDMKPKTLINLVLKKIKEEKNSVDLIDSVKTRLDFYDPWPDFDPVREEKNSVNLMLIGFITATESYLPFASMVDRSKSDGVCIAS